MKLITNFKDYYDGIAHGVMNDPFYRYERFKKIHELDDYSTSRYDIDINISQHRTGQYSINEVTASFFILGFCGKIYYGYRYHDTFDKLNLVEYYTPEQIDKKEMQSKHWKYPVNKHRTRFHWAVFGKTISEIFRQKELESYFVKYNTPCFVIDEFVSDSEGKPTTYLEKDCRSVNGILINPALGDYEFAKVIDPYTACQEIDMYLGNVLVQDQSGDMSGISDEHLRDSKGFDKMSFKKVKTKKR